MPSETVLLALISALGLIGVAYLKYLGDVRKLDRANGNRPVPNPAAPKLTAAQADEIYQGIYARLLNETQEDRERLRAELAAVSADLTEERRVRRMLEVRVGMLEGEATKSKERETALLQTIAEQRGEIERLTRQVDELRAQSGGRTAGG